MSREGSVGLLRLIARQSDSTSGSTVTVDCSTGNDYDGRMGIRVSAIFVILAGSFLGAWFPVFAARHRGIGVPDWAFFVAKYFGSGVIIATAFIHVSLPWTSVFDALFDSSSCLLQPLRHSRVLALLDQSPTTHGPRVLRL